MARCVWHRAGDYTHTDYIVCKLAAESAPIRQILGLDMAMQGRVRGYRLYAGAKGQGKARQNDEPWPYTVPVQHGHSGVYMAV